MNPVGLNASKYKIILQVVQAGNKGAKHVPPNFVAAASPRSSAFVTFASLGYSLRNASTGFFPADLRAR